MSAPRLVLHVGLQQTGATMGYRALERLRPRLARRGVGLVGPPALAELPVAGWRNRAPVDEGEAARFADGLAELVARELARLGPARRGAGARTVLLSSDQLLGRDNLDADDERRLRPLAQAAVGQVIDALDPVEVRVLCYVRRQDRLMEACHLRALQQGATDGLLERFPGWHEPTLDYEPLLARLEALPRVREVRVRPFELVGASAPVLARDLLSALGLPGRLAAGVPADLRPYRLYSRRAAEIARDVNRHLDTAEERRLVRDFLRSQYPGTDDASTRLASDEERRTALDARAEANRRLFERRMPDLPADAYASDAATARLAGLAPQPPRRRALWPRRARRATAATGPAGMP